MKQIYIFFILGLCIILISSIYLQFKKNQYPYDSEQIGLDEQIIIKFSHVVAENTPKGQAVQKFAKLVHEKTNNSVKVEVFPNGILYSDEEAVEALKQNTIQMIAPASSKISTYFPEFQILDLPFAFSNYDAVDAALNGEIGQSLLALMENEGLLGLSFWYSGFKQMTSNKGPLIEPNNFYGQHFRIMPSKTIESQFNMFNVRTSRISFNSTYKNLENGTVDGQENTLSNIYSKKFYEVQDYMTISNHGLISYIVLTNEKFWEKLPRGIQNAILEAMKEASLWNHQESIRINKEALKNIKKSSDIQIHYLTKEQKEKWIKELTPVYKHHREIIGDNLMKELEGIQRSVD